MGPTSSIDEPPPLRPEERLTLLSLARQSIDYRLKHGEPLAVDPAQFPPRLRVRQASFVTLTLDDLLRGCIGNLLPDSTLVESVARNAGSAAVSDPRFPPLTTWELSRTRIHVSVLSLPQALDFTSEAGLIRQLRCGIDGLILSEGGRRGTFLPSVWESLPDPAEFLRQLKRKAGLPPDYWSEQIRAERYSSESVAEPADSPP